MRLANLCLGLLMPGVKLRTALLHQLPQMCEGREVLSHLVVNWSCKVPADESIVREICQLQTEGANCKQLAGEKRRMKTGGKIVGQTPMGKTFSLVGHGSHNCALRGILLVERIPVLDVSLKQALGESCRPVRSVVHETARSMVQPASNRWLVREIGRVAVAGEHQLTVSPARSHLRRQHEPKRRHSALVGAQTKN